MSENQISVLILSGNPKKYRLIMKQLSQEEWTVSAIGNIKKALQYIMQKKPNYVFLSINFPGVPALKITKLISATFNIPVVLFPEEFDFNTTRMLREANWKDTLSVPISGPAIRTKIKLMMTEAGLINQKEEEKLSALTAGISGETSTDELSSGKKRKKQRSAEEDTEESIYTKKKKKRKRPSDASEDDILAKAPNPKKRKRRSELDSTESGEEVLSSGKKKKKKSTAAHADDVIATGKKVKKKRIKEDGSEEEYFEDSSDIDEAKLKKTDEFDLQSLLSGAAEEEYEDEEDESSEEYDDESEDEAELEDDEDYEDDDYEDDDDENIDEDEYEDEDSDESESESRLSNSSSSKNKKNRKHSDDEYTDEDSDDSDNGAGLNDEYEEVEEIDENGIAKKIKRKKKKSNNKSDSSSDKNKSKDDPNDLASIYQSLLSGDDSIDENDEDIVTAEEDEDDESGQGKKESANSASEAVFKENQTENDKSSKKAKHDKSEAVSANDTKVDRNSENEEYEEYETEEEYEVAVDENGNEVDASSVENTKTVKKVKKTKKVKKKRKKLKPESSKLDPRDAIVEKTKKAGSDDKDEAVAEDSTIHKTEANFKPVEDKTGKAETAQLKKSNILSENPDDDLKDEHESHEDYRRRTSNRQKSPKLITEEDYSNKFGVDFLEDSISQICIKTGKSLGFGVDTNLSEIGIVEQLIVIPVFEQDKNALVLIASSQNDITASGFVGSLKKNISVHMKNVNFDLDIANPSILSTPNLDFSKWAAQIQCPKTQIKIGKDIVQILFMKSEGLIPKLSMDSNGKMMSVSIDSFEADKNVNVDLYLHLPNNNKFIKYIGSGRSIESDQKNRLKSKKVENFHIQNDDISKLKEYFVESYLKKKIAG